MFMVGKRETNNIHQMGLAATLESKKNT